MHRGVGIQRGHAQFHAGRLPHPLPHGPSYPKNLPGDLKSRSEARKRQKVDWGGSFTTLRMPVSMGSRSMTRMWLSCENPTPRKPPA
jgi:hypothetical protein